MIDWANLFGLSVNPVEIFVRGTVIYWFIFLLFRFLLRRDIGAIAIADVMLVVLIADAASNGMSGGYESITDGCILVATIAGWNYTLNWVGFHFKSIRHLIQPPPEALVLNGKMQRKAMRRELITTEELQSKLREQGIEHLNEVKIAYLEEDGEISVLRHDNKEPEQSPDPKKNLLALSLWLRLRNPEEPNMVSHEQSFPECLVAGKKALFSAERRYTREQKR